MSAIETPTGSPHEHRQQTVLRSTSSNKQQLEARPRKTNETESPGDLVFVKAASASIHIIWPPLQADQLHSLQLTNIRSPYSSSTIQFKILLFNTLENVAPHVNDHQTITSVLRKNPFDLYFLDLCYPYAFDLHGSTLEWGYQYRTYQF